jgi:hypothetical protein
MISSFVTKERKSHPSISRRCKLTIEALAYSPSAVNGVGWKRRCPVFFYSNEEPEQLIRYAALIHNSVMTATSTEQWETSCLVNDAFGMTSWLFQDVSDVTFIVFASAPPFALVFTPVPHCNEPVFIQNYFSNITECPYRNTLIEIHKYGTILIA